ncbi:hypothetical protein VCHA29O37_640003 [Vibrio chagasii]|nr:hypothetical protein VCHA29O37_640003 [Vibrio chagasii]
MSLFRFFALPSIDIYLSETGYLVFIFWILDKMRVVLCRQ